MHPSYNLNEYRLRLSIAADARFCSPDYANDHIWELAVGSGMPDALSLQTTFGLRARSLRVFPRFLRRNAQATQPRSFARPPRLISYYSNYMAVDFSPFVSIDVTCEYWVPEPGVVAGRIRIHNNSVLPEALRLELACLLSPLVGGESMANEKLGKAEVLRGRTGNLALVCCLSGHNEAGTGPYPALTADFDLVPGASQQRTWVLSAQTEADLALEQAHRTISRAWDAEIGRVELQNNAQLVRILTGDPAWDQVFDLSQKMAYGLFFKGGEYLPEASFVLNRQPDQGFSTSGDGSDYSYAWNGQTPLDAYYLSYLLLPGGSALLRGVLTNFLFTQTEDGAIDWKPGLAGQRSRRLAQPLLASLAWRLFQQNPDRNWLAHIYPALLNFARHWFTSANDRDSDGYPEWSHPLSTGWEDSPIYDRWHTGGLGVNICYLESPALAAMLYRECASLLQISQNVDDAQGAAWLSGRMDALKDHLKACWDAPAGIYRYRDAVSHTTHSGKTLLEASEPGIYAVKRSFRTPERLHIRLHRSHQRTQPTQLILRGQAENGAVEVIVSPNQIAWAGERGFHTTFQLFKGLDEVEIRGLPAGDQVQIATIHTKQEDLSLLLPLWAGIPDKKRAGLLVERALKRRFLQTNGLSMGPAGEEDPEPHGPGQHIHLPWNSLLIEGLLAYGYRQEAADIFSRLMRAACDVLNAYGGFRAALDSRHSKAYGEQNTLAGLAPVGQFLDLLGLKIISKDEIIVEGFNPFPWPVTVQYQGMSVTRNVKETVIIFSSGQTITIEGSEPQRIYLPRESE
jgi:hypothetical protein